MQLRCCLYVVIIAVLDDRGDSLIGRASASYAGGLGFDSRPVHAKELNNGAYYNHTRRSVSMVKYGRLVCHETTSKGLSPFCGAYCMVQRWI